MAEGESRSPQARAHCEGRSSPPALAVHRGRQARRRYSSKVPLDEPAKAQARNANPNRRASCAAPSCSQFRARLTSRTVSQGPIARVRARDGDRPNQPEPVGSLQEVPRGRPSTREDLLAVLTANMLTTTRDRGGGGPHPLTSRAKIPGSFYNRPAATRRRRGFPASATANGAPEDGRPRRSTRDMGVPRDRAGRRGPWRIFRSVHGAALTVPDQGQGRQRAHGRLEPRPAGDGQPPAGDAPGRGSAARSAFRIREEEPGVPRFGWFGEGRLPRGGDTPRKAMNLAGVRKLPVVFRLRQQTNQWALPRRRPTFEVRDRSHVADRAEAYGFEGAW